MHEKEIPCSSPVPIPLPPLPWFGFQDPQSLQKRQIDPALSHARGQKRETGKWWSPAKLLVQAERALASGLANGPLDAAFGSHANVPDVP